MPVSHSLSNLHICASGCNFSFAAIILPKYSTIISFWWWLKRDSPCFFLTLFNEWQTHPVYIIILMASLKVKPGMVSHKPCDFSLYNSEPYSIGNPTGWWHHSSPELGTALETICSDPGWEEMQNLFASQRKAAIKSLCWQVKGKLQSCRI